MAVKNPETDFLAENFETKQAQAQLLKAEEYELLRVPTNDARHLSMINRFNLLTPDGVMGLKGFIFMTKPNLNLFSTSSDTNTSYSVSQSALEINPDLARLPTFKYIYNLGRNEYKSDATPWLGQRIYSSLEYFGTYNIGSLWSNDKYPLRTPWLSVITNRSKGYTVASRDLDSVDVGNTFHGNKVVYGEPTFKHKVGGEITIDFSDSRDFSLYYTLKLWVEYIQAVSIGIAAPFRKYITNAVLDYAASLYYVVTDETMENIVYWEKLTGVFPKTVPDDIFSTNERVTPKELSYSVTFAYSMRSVQQETHLLELNSLYSITTDNDIVCFNTDSNGALKDIRVNGSSYGPYALAKNIRTAENITSEHSAIVNAIKLYYTHNVSNAFTRHNQYVSPKLATMSIFPNYLPEIQMHGVPYVNGPYITLGSSEDGININNKSQSARNKSQYKLRWI